MTTSPELAQSRRERWRLTPERAVRTLDDAREFLRDVGFCLLYPVRPAVVVPTFIGATLGAEESLPTTKQAAVDPRARLASELVIRLLNEKLAFEVPYGSETSLLVSAAEFPYFYALIGERNPKTPPSAGPRGEKMLVRHTFELIQKAAATEQQLLTNLGKSISESALVRALQELWSHLRIVRIDSRASDHANAITWDALSRWAEKEVRTGMHMSRDEALSFLISRYLESVVAAEPREVEDFFGPFAAKSKIREVVKAMSAAREFENVPGTQRIRIREVVTERR